MSVQGLNTTPIHIEVDINSGLPAFTIVGLADQGVQESKERIRSALKIIHHKLPSQRITVNLAPANLKKNGSLYDLPIALGILHHQGVIEDSEILASSIFIGELSLDASLRPASGVLPTVLGAKEAGYKYVFIPEVNKLEASIIPGISVIPVKNLLELVDMLNGDTPLKVMDLLEFSGTDNPSIQGVDFKYVIGQIQSRRALEIAAAGGHNVIMQGPPGSGKSFLAKAYSTILPDISLEEAIEVSKIYSISGLLSEKNPLIRHRPFRSIHHTASSVSIIGGGSGARPGEISLAHHGVLFLDELLEFPKAVLEVLRQPLEDGTISISRAQASYTYPANFSLLAAFNPCPCGYLTDPDKACSCSDYQINQYKSRLSGPLLDRVDIFLEVPKIPTEDFNSHKAEEEESSYDIKSRVMQARQLQSQRFQGKNIIANADMTSKDIEDLIELSPDARVILSQGIERFKLSGRSYFRIIKLARTIADLDSSDIIQKFHVLEALSFRKNNI